MARSARNKVGPGPRNAWDSALDRLEGAFPTQAGEVPSGLEEGLAGGDKGRDAETGLGGYAGDTVEAGVEEAGAQPDRPTDAEIHGDPRTHDGDSYPDDAKRMDDRQGPIGQSAVEGEIRDA